MISCRILMRHNGNLQNALPVAMRDFCVIIVQPWAVDSRFVAVETGVGARFRSRPQPEELKIDRVSRRSWPL